MSCGEGVLDFGAGDDLLVGKVFGINRGAAGVVGRGKYQGVPEGELVLYADVHRGQNQRNGDFHNREFVGKIFYKFFCGLL